LTGAPGPILAAPPIARCKYRLHGKERTDGPKRQRFINEQERGSCRRKEKTRFGTGSGLASHSIIMTFEIRAAGVIEQRHAPQNSIGRLRRAMARNLAVLQQRPTWHLCWSRSRL